MDRLGTAHSQRRERDRDGGRQDSRDRASGEARGRQEIARRGDREWLHDGSDTGQAAAMGCGSDGKGEDKGDEDDDGDYQHYRYHGHEVSQHVHCSPPLLCGPRAPTAPLLLAVVPHSYS